MHLKWTLGNVACTMLKAIIKERDKEKEYFFERACNGCTSYLSTKAPACLCDLLATQYVSMFLESVVLSIALLV